MCKLLLRAAKKGEGHSGSKLPFFGDFTRTLDIVCLLQSGFIVGAGGIASVLKVLERIKSMPQKV